jgi:hypothetical protein
MIDSVNDPATSKEKSTDYEFLDCIGVGTGSVEDGDTEFCHASYRDVVGSSSTTSNGTHSLFNFLLLELVGSHQKSMGGLRSVSGSLNLINFGWESTEALLLDMKEKGSRVNIQKVSHSQVQFKWSISFLTVGEILL